MHTYELQAGYCSPPKVAIGTKQGKRLVVDKHIAIQTEKEQPIMIDAGTQSYLVEEQLEHYRDGYIGRREFIRRAGLLGVGVGLATSMAQTVTPAATAAPVAQAVSPLHVPEDDASVTTDWVWFPSSDGVLVKAYLAWPASAMMNASYPGVTVCHENMGLNPHTRDVARRFAKAGYVAIAPDLPARVGVVTDESTPDQIMEAYRQLDAAQNARDFEASLQALASNPAVDASKLAATGYCFGGGVTWRLATIAPQLRAAAPFYGAAPPLDDVRNIRAAVLGVYAGNDERINASIPDLQRTAQEAGVTLQVNNYPNVDHAFHADFRPVYNQVVAVQAWKDTLNWFAFHLELPSPVFSV